MLKIKERLETELLNLGHEHKLRRLVVSTGHDFCSNDYLGLGGHERVINTASLAIKNFGYGARSSRFIRGEHEIYQELEARLAQFSGFKKSLIFSSGYAANVGSLSALIKKGDMVFSDRLNHASIIDGLRLSGAQIVIYEHLNLKDLKGKLKIPAQAAKFLVTESLFSMDGDIAPLDELAQIATEQDLALIVDESHAVGLYGQNGAGLIDHFGIAPQVFLSINGLGKSFGCFGAFVSGDDYIIEYLVQKARTLMYSTALPHVALAAIDEALNLVIEGELLRRQLFNNIEFFNAELGLKESELLSPIIPIIVGSSEKTLAVAKLLKNQGFDIKAIRPPTVPEGSSRLRLSIHANHSKELLSSLVKHLRNIL